MRNVMEYTPYFIRDIDFSDDLEINNCMKHFSSNGNASLNFKAFKNLMFDVLKDPGGESLILTDETLADWFACFDRNRDRKLDTAEFATVWNDFIKPLVRPVTALLIIDVQNDFIEGSLALKNCQAKQDGSSVIPVINHLLENLKFDVVVYTIDHHPKNHISFFDNVKLYKLSDKITNIEKIKMFETVVFEGSPEIEQKLWPVHCVQNTWGCELHKDLKQIRDSIFIHKGENPQVDSYSAFFDNMKLSSTVLHEELQKRNVTHVLVCGVALDFCVAFTCLDAIELGYATCVIQDGTRGTDDNSIRDVENKLKYANCVFIHSQEVNSILHGNCKVEFASSILNRIKKV